MILNKRFCLTITILFLFFSLKGEINIYEPLVNSTYNISDTIIFNWDGFATKLQTSSDSSFSNYSEFPINSTSISIASNSLGIGKHFFRLINHTDTSNIKSFLIIDINSLGILLYKVQCETGVSLSNNLVNKWVNQIDTFYNAYQNMQNFQPKFISNKFNNKNVLGFGIGNQSVSYLNLNTLEIPDSNYTIFTTVQNQIPLSNLSVLMSGIDSSSIFQLYTGGVINNGFLMGGAKTPNFLAKTGLSSTDFDIFTYKHNKLSVNSLTVNPNLSGGNQTISSVFFETIGARLNSIDLNFQGFLGDIIIFNSILSDSSTLLVENYLKTKYTPFPYLGDDLFVCDTKTKIGFRTDHPYSNITWSTGQTGLDSIEITQNGTYWVEVVSFGWTISDTIKITGILDPPQISYNQDTVLCLGDSLTVNYIPIPDYVPVWSSGDTANSYTIKDFSQNVYLVHYDTNNCFASTDTFFIKIDSLQLFSTLGDDRNLCNGGTLAVSTTSTEGPFEYLWSTTDTTPSINFSSYGLFNISVEMTDFNECVFRDTVQINSININVPTVQFEFDTACPGLPTQFTDLSTPGGTDNVVSWVWTFNTSDSAFINNPSFTFPEGIFPVHLSVLTDSGCTNSTQQLINTYPSPTSDFNTTIACANDTVTLNQLSTINPNDSIISFEWIIQGNSFFGSSIQTTFDSADTYSLQLISTSSNFCKDTLSLPIEIFPEFLIDFDFENTCLRDTTKFTNTSPSLSIIDKQWNFDFFGQSSQDDNPVFYYPNTGTYDVEYTCVNAIGCQSSITKTVTIRPNPTASFETDAPCNTNATLFFNNDSSSLLNQHTWSINNDTISGDSAIVRFDIADNYLIYYSITDSFGCSDDTSQFVNISEGPIADFSFTPNYGTSPINIQFVNNSQNANSYFWDFGDGNTSIEINPINNYQNNDTYSITLWANDSLACVDSISKNLPIIPTDLDIELSNLQIISSPQTDGSVRYTPIVTIKNVGTRLISNFDLALSINQEIPIIESWEGTLPIGASLLYTLSNTLDIYSPSTFDYLCVNAKNVNDNTEVNFSNNKVCVSNKNELQLSNVYPNPATNIAQIEIIANSDGKSNAYIYDKIGQQISSTNLNLSEGYNVLQFDCSNLQSGEYYILFEFQNENYSRKFWVTNQ